MTNNPTSEIILIAAIDNNNGIGRDGDLLCHLPNDLKHFKRVTTGETVIMGRKTYESLPKGALPNRTNIVITSDIESSYPNSIVVRSVEEALSCSPKDKKIFIIGGGMLYRATFHIADWLYITRIHHSFDDVDTFFPNIDLAEWKLLQECNFKSDKKHKYDYSFQTYIRSV